MTLNDFIVQLQKVRESRPEAGALPVYYRHGASGDCGELSSARITDQTDECGPFDVESPDGFYVSIYAGN